MSGISRKLGPAVILALWLVGAIVFAWRRIPFHDEWLWLTLARDATPDRFMASLRADVHPPWLSLLDRWLLALGAGRRILAVPRIAASFVAILVLRRVVHRRWPGSPPLWTALAAFHPVVFMYAGAVRWYPIAFLADALRAWALWGEPRSQRRAAGAFLAGAVLGPAVGYGELVLVALDCIWLAAAKRIASRRVSATLVVVALAFAGATIVASPLTGHFAALIHGDRGRFAGVSISALVTWAALGPLGEALPPSPWTAMYLAAVPGVVLAVGYAARQPETRLFSSWVLTTAVGWAFLTGHGVVHPRYSLALWVLTTCALGMPLVDRGLVRVAAVVTAVYLALDFVLTIGQRSFPLADENVMKEDDCRRLVPSGGDLIVTAYERTTVEIDRICHPKAPLVTAGFVSHYLDEPMGEVAGIRDALHAGEIVDFVSVNVTTVSLAQTNADVRAALSERCELTASTAAGEIPHAWLRSVLKPDLPQWHYTSERWSCLR